MGVVDADGCADKDMGLWRLVLNYSKIPGIV